MCDRCDEFQDEPNLSACNFHESIRVRYGDLKAAQNEAFQDGIKFALKQAIDSNEKAYTFHTATFNAMIRTLESVISDTQLYEQPICVCEDE